MRPALRLWGLLLMVPLSSCGRTNPRSDFKRPRSGDILVVAPTKAPLPGAIGTRIAVSSRNGDTHHVVSLLNIRAPLIYGDYRWNEEGVPVGPIWVRVDLREQLMSVFRSGHEIGTTVILYGADRKPTPLGTFAILARFKDHRSGPYDAPMPYTLRLTPDGVSIHGSNVRWGAATHGCVGVPLEFARRLFEQARVGDPVTITDDASPRVVS